MQGRLNLLDSARRVTCLYPRERSRHQPPAAATVSLKGVLGGCWGCPWLFVAVVVDIDRQLPKGGYHTHKKDPVLGTVLRGYTTRGLEGECPEKCFEKRLEKCFERYLERHLEEGYR